MPLKGFKLVLCVSRHGSFRTSAKYTCLRRPRHPLSKRVRLHSMSDRFDAATRSRIMSRITKKWSQIDRKIRNILKSAKVHHAMYPELAGSPDVLVYPDILVFLDGCFWHCCPKCFRLPKSRLKYWRPKLFGNKSRDVKVSRLLRKQGWRVVRIWEHEIRAKPNGILRQLDKLGLERAGRRPVGSPHNSASVSRSIRRR